MESESDSEWCRDVDDESIALFKSWLIENGAKFDKIDWPSSKTNSGIRGAVALEDIETNEVMLSIPSSLMLTPEKAFADSVMGEVFRKNKDVLRGDLLLTMYMSYELSKGENSFYAPFFRILPSPGVISTWKESELVELQDDKLLHRAQNKRQQLKTVYRGLVGVLSSRHPDLVSPDIFTYRRFAFSFDTIQARAFGRRLPWTALVPFADCLNHANVQTKYDYDMDNNQTFRLFPTGKNRYGAGFEVFNSYGRRPNDNLLLDYGFAMMDNEWDHVSVFWKIPVGDPLIEEKKGIACDYGFSYIKRLCLYRDAIPAELFVFFRIAALTSRELSYLKETLNPTVLDNPLSLQNEILALRLFSNAIEEFLSDHPTTEEQDCCILRDLAVSDDNQSALNRNWKLACAVIYRVTRKRILQTSIKALRLLLDWLDRLVIEREQFVENDIPEEYKVNEAERMLKNLKDFYLSDTDRSRKYDDSLNTESTVVSDDHPEPTVIDS